MTPEEEAERARVLAALELLEDFPEDGCGHNVVSSADLDTVCEWIESGSQDMEQLKAELATNRLTEGHFGR